MDKFTIYCTEEQTKKALELGAPIELESEYYRPTENDFKLDEPIPCESFAMGYHYVKCPTAEQMFNWLEYQGFLISITACNTPDNPIYNYSINRCEESWSTFCSRKEVTLAAIDAALDYLIKNKMEEHIDLDKELNAFVDNKKMLELVDFINCVLDINKCSEDIYTILSYMCRNGYFSNWEFKNEDIFIDGHQVTKNGIFVKGKDNYNQVTEKLLNEYVDLGLPSGTLWAKCNIGAEKRDRLR